MELTVGITDARQRFSELFDRVWDQGDFVIVLKYGKPTAVFVLVELYEQWKTTQSGERATPKQP